jgi:Xaa-Pro aminopeptidase
MAKKGPAPVYGERLRRCRAALGNGAAALLITNRPDHIYLTGFTGEDSAVLLTQRGVHLISDGRFATSIRQEAPWAKVSLRRGQLLDEIATVVSGEGIKKLAVQADVMTSSQRQSLEKKLRGVRIVDGPPITNDMRKLKEAAELRLLNKAIRIAQDAYNATLKTIRLGQTELDLAAQLEFEMKRRGSTTPAFDSIVAIDANSALPHAVPGTRKVRKGCTILFDWGATYRFYRSDLTRTIFIGSIPPRLGEVYEAVLEGQRLALAAIRPGARMCDVDAVARQHIGQAGFGEEFNHGLGHGLGLNVHEAPSLSWRSDEKLAPGMVVTVEPGVYLPGVGGVRIEDDVLVTARGRRILSHLPKDLKSAVRPAVA